MRLNTLAKAAGVGGLALAVALIAVVKSIDVNRYKGFLSAQVRAATGRELIIAGPLELKLGLVPSMVATGVSLGNMPGGSQPEMARAERVEAEVALLPLLSRRIEIRRLVLIKPDILLETDRKGRANWDLAAGGAAVPEDGESPPTRLGAHNITVKDARITWRDGSTGTTRLVSLPSLAVEPQGGATGPLAVTLKGMLDDQPFTIDGTVGPLADIGTGAPWPVKLKGSGAGAVGSLDGTIAAPLDLAGLSLKFDLTGEDLAGSLRAAGLADLPPVGPYKVSGRLSGAVGALGVTQLDLALGRRDAAVLTAKGTVKDIERLRGVELAMMLESDDLGGLSALAGAELPALGPLTVSGKLTDAKGAWALSDIKAALAGSAATGELVLTDGVRPRLTGTLAATSLALADLTPRPAAEPAGTAADRLFPDQPLPVAALRAMDADVALSVETLDLGGSTLTGVTAQLRVTGGRATVKPFAAGLAGGRIEGGAMLDGSIETPFLTLSLTAADVELARVAKQAAPVVEGGRTNARIGLAGKGATVRALMGNLSGDALIDVGAGRIRSSTVGWAGDTLVGVLTALVPADETTALHCGVINLKVKDGIARADKGIAIETAKVDLVGAGTIDLRSEELDIGLTPRSRDGIGLGVGSALAEMTRIRGTLANPSVGVDGLGTARAAASVGAAVATGGLSLLGEMLFDKITTDYSPCRTALGKTGKKG